MLLSVYNSRLESAPCRFCLENMMLQVSDKNVLSIKLTPTKMPELDAKFQGVALVSTVILSSGEKVEKTINIIMGARNLSKMIPVKND